MPLHAVTQFELEKMSDSIRHLSDHLMPLHPSVGFHESTNHSEDHGFVSCRKSKHFKSLSGSRSCLAHAVTWNVMVTFRPPTLDNVEYLRPIKHRYQKGREAQQGKSGVEPGRVLIGTRTPIHKIQWVRWSAVHTKSSKVVFTE